MPQRRLEYWLLVCSLDGDEHIVVEGFQHDIPSGGSYLVPPGALHDLGSQRGNVPVWFHFDLIFDPRRSALRQGAGPYDSELGARARHLQPDARQLWGIDLPVSVPAPLDAVYRAELPGLVPLHRTGPPGRLLAEAQLALLLARLVALSWLDGPTSPRADALDRLERAEALVRQRLDTGPGLQEFAAAAGLGRSRFCQLYRALRGEPPGSFLARERQQRIEILLRDTDLDLAQIARLAGFGDATAMLRAFRRCHGMSPGVWRRESRRVSAASRWP